MTADLLEILEEYFWGLIYRFLAWLLGLKGE